MVTMKSCPVGYLTKIRPHPTKPTLQIGEIAGHQVVVGDHYEEGNLGFYIPPGAVLPQRILSDMWLWNSEHNKGRLAGKRGDRVKAREMDGVMSDGLFYGAYYFNRNDEDYDFDNYHPITTQSWNEDWVDGQDVSAELGITFKED